MRTGTKILGLIGGAVLLILMQDNLWLIVMVMVGAAVLTGLGAGLRELHRQEREEAEASRFLYEYRNVGTGFDPDDSEIEPEWHD